MMVQVQRFIPADDTVKITLDLSENGPVFNALDEMMMKMLEDDASDRKKPKKSGGGAGGGEAKKALKSLLKSGIPGSKKKFMKAIFGEDGTAIETGTAAALIAATCSGGDPEVGDKIAQLLVPELGDKIDPAMMAALMVACSMISAGAGMEEVLKAMKAELLDSGMSEEDIFRKTQLLMQAFGRDESGSLAEYSLVGKQKNSALKKIELSPKDFAQIVLLQRTIAASGATPENIAKVIMIENQLSKRGAQHRHIADALKKLIDPNKGRKDTIEKLSKAITDVKMKKEDVQASVRVMQALEMENEPTWERTIELNLARATKAAGINRGEFTKILVAQKAMSVLGIDAKHLAQVMNIEKVIADNGVPAVEIARVLSDGGVPVDAHKKLAEITAAGLEKDFCAADVDSFVNLYDNFKLKSNIPDETIEHIDKTLIQVRCSLEDVADNLICSMNARGEKEHVIIRNLCETLKDTGASVQIVGTTMMGSLGKALPKTEPELMKDTGRSLTEVGYCTEDVNSTMTEILLNVLDEKPEMREDAVRACEVVMKDSGQFPDQIRKHLDAVLPPEEKKMDPRLAEDGSEIEYDESNRPIPKKPKNMAKAIKDRTGSGVSSRRGSSIGTTPRGSISIGGTERRGSFYSDDVSKRNSVAIVVDDPDNKINMEKALNEVFNNESKDEGYLRDVLLEERTKLNTLKGKEREAQLAIIEALESSFVSKEGPEGGPGVVGNQISDIQESLLKSEMEKISELSGKEREDQMAKVESLKQSLSSSSPEQTHSINEGPSWKDRLASLASVDPSELSIENSLKLVDKELEKIAHLPESKKAIAMNELQLLKRGLLTDIIKDPDQSKDKILRLLDNKQGDSGIDSIQATQILNLLNQAVTSDASTSSKPEQNLMEIEKILGSQNVTGLSSKVNQGQLSKVLNAVSGPDIKSTFTSRQQHQQSNQAVTDGSALLIGKGQTTNNKQETIQDILNLQQSGNNPSSQLELIQQLTSLGTILKEPSEEVANIIYSKGLSSLKDPEQAQEIVKGILSQRALGSKPDEVLQMAKILSNEAAQTDRTGSLLAQKEKDTSMFSQIVPDDTILSQDIVEALAQSGKSPNDEKKCLSKNFPLKYIADSSLAEIGNVLESRRKETSGTEKGKTNQLDLTLGLISSIDEPLPVTAYQDNARARRTLLFQDTPSRNTLRDHQNQSLDLEYTDFNNIQSDRQLAEQRSLYQVDGADSSTSRRIEVSDLESEMNLYSQKRIIDPKLTSSRVFEPYSPSMDNESGHLFELNSSPASYSRSQYSNIMLDESDNLRSKRESSSHLFKDEIKNRGSYRRKGVDLEESATLDYGASSSERSNLRAYISDSNTSKTRDVTCYDYEPLKHSGTRNDTHSKSKYSNTLQSEKECEYHRSHTERNTPLDEIKNRISSTRRGVDLNDSPVLDYGSSSNQRSNLRTYIADLDTPHPREVASYEYEPLEDRSGYNMRGSSSSLRDILEDSNAKAQDRESLTRRILEIKKKITRSPYLEMDKLTQKTLTRPKPLMDTNSILFNSMLRRAKRRGAADDESHGDGLEEDCDYLDIETYRHPASLGIGVIGTGNQHLVRRNVQRRVSRYRALEESRESSIDEDRRITGLRRAKVPLMVYSCGGFTRCYRIARFHTVDGPPIGLKYRENPTSGL
ncbi:unnamed protein product [Lepeophtheirus salmonis]|uniref:(salmon louse) hypothetical protein n=1 Tax=Lepeophtheirus salmonis TaxID=72036 RepID=A0A7R8DCV7_LEPSM|nr:unnamed protein product [Lepeophtheirus salmonis]CAF3045824.1 unnamed protein product [Lepeophtheirus salmonis]